MKILIRTLLLSAFFSVSIAADMKEKYAAPLKKLTSQDLEIKSAVNSPIKGVVELIVDSGRGSEVYYISEDGKYLINGTIFDIENRKDITEIKKSALRKELISGISDAQRINFYPENMTHRVTVFTDIDCGYCRKLHSEIAGYNELGIGVSYLFFPRAGMKSASYDKAASVWCANNQQDAMTRSKAGEELPKKECDNPIGSHYDAGMSAGVTGTPAIVTDNGQLMPGYLPPSSLKQRLDLLAVE